MANFFVRVELQGTPSDAVYQRLHSLMARHNFTQTVWGSAGLSNLPHATYHGASAQSASAIAATLHGAIASEVWTKPVVLAMPAMEWAMQPALKVA